jgi:hypothetical protein
MALLAAGVRLIMAFSYWGEAGGEKNRNRPFFASLVP